MKLWFLKERIALQYEMGEVSKMRKLVAVTVLGAALAFGTGAAFASDSVDYTGPSQPIKSVPTVSQAQTDHSMVAGGDTGMGPRVYEQLRDENFGS